jgi:GT2 family glycosyltransferase
MPEALLENRIPLSVVMMTRNEAHNIKACLESLQDYAEIIVVDNGSTVASFSAPGRAMVEPDKSALTLPHRIGFCGSMQMNA